MKHGGGVFPLPVGVLLPEYTSGILWPWKATGLSVQVVIITWPLASVSVVLALIISGIGAVSEGR